MRTMDKMCQLSIYPREVTNVRIYLFSYATASDFPHKTNTWHSHGRMIGIGTLTKALRLEVDDYTDQVERRKKINSYHDVMIDYMRQKQMTVLLHARHTLGV